MKVSVKKVDSCRRKIEVEVPPERVQKKLNEVFDEMSKKAKVKGFRQGKVPRHVLEAEHGAVAREEMVRKIIPEVYGEVLEQEKLAPLDLPEIADVALKDGKVSFTALVDIKPEVDPGRYKGIKIKRKSSRVTDEEIKKTLEYFQKSRGQEDAPLDDAFARGMGYPNLAAFKESLARQIELDKDRQNRLDVENQIVETLLSRAKLSLPSSLVKRQLDHRLADAVQRMKEQGMPEEEMAKKEKELRQELLPAVEKDVKIYLIFDAIAEKEGLERQEGESLSQKVMEFLLKEAEWEEASPVSS